MSVEKLDKMDQLAQEFETFKKYLRYFCIRMVHVVVHSRMGIPLKQPCEAYPPNSEWFSFKHDEIGEVSAFLKQSIKTYPPLVPSLTIDFFLYTVSGDTLPLESWVVRVFPHQSEDKVDQSSYASNRQLYHQLGTLLMSVCAAARVTPTARYYASSQSESTYVLCYRVFEAEPELELLGPEHKTFLLGNYPTRFGTVQVELNYRTKMELSISSIVNSEKNTEYDEDKNVTGILIKTSNPAKKAAEQKLLVNNDRKPKAKNWSNPLSEGLPFIADMSRPRAVPQSHSVGSEPSMPTLYQFLPADVLEKMPHTLKVAKSSECGSTPRSESSMGKRDFFPFSSLTCHWEEDQKGSNAQSDSASLSNFRFPLCINSSSESSGNSKRCDSDVSTSSSIRGSVRQKHRKTDDVFGLLEDDGEALQTSESNQERMAVSLPATILPIPEKIGSDLNDFVREVSMAPRSMNSFGSNESIKHLNEQIEYFKQQAPSLKNFINSMQGAVLM